ncbi:ATP-binding protein [Rhodococcus sp. HNM0569]|uniref:sacsin N-terminal ATP-binding-like domain-containing protein n=1 Tax=Rhodococcus sp. HNM0569 TaxID=2716340 RepID=UPI00146B042C|nr:ATP-binding protein [Rhodococcus sp. HNM0569]NLU82431.1 ATP-binding protein [Rhodococcus sp. HNM0569]
MPTAADPFDTRALRSGVLSAWASSPTRLREDAHAEGDLVEAGYRDRVFTELAQNAADAAARAGVAGRIRVRVDDGVLSVANTGRPLDAPGLRALVALRASDKDAGTDPAGVGRFGVGFTSVLALGDHVEVRSTSGSVLLSRERTRREIETAGLTAPDVGVPALRLAWPIDAAPADGFDTEIRVTLGARVDVQELAAAIAREAVDVLLELPALESIALPGDAGPLTRTSRRVGELTEITIGEGTWWQHESAHARWLVPVQDGVVRPVGEVDNPDGQWRDGQWGDVLRAPTRSDEQLSLPALVIADVAMQPDRRRVLPGARLEHVADGYADFVAALPVSQRAKMVPVPAFARGEVDGVLREAVVRVLRDGPWAPTVDGRVVAGARARVVTGLTDELAHLLRETIDDLVDPAVSGTRYAPAWAAVDAHRLGLARIAELLAGAEREPRWWHALYDALTPFVADPVAAEELAAIPVPLADGRTVTGPRTTVTGTDDLDVRGVTWARTVHPDAVHPLLSRLGAQPVTAADLLAEPALRDLVEDCAAGELDDDTADGLTGAVLALAAHAAPADVPSWLGELPLPDVDGELVPADELLLPESPLAAVLADDAPFTTVDADLAATAGAAALTALGVGWSFTTVRADDPTGPDHGLDDEDTWWGQLADEPSSLVAARDLELVDPARWADALALLAHDPATAPLLADRDGYTAWWLRTHAVLDGATLGVLRHPDDSTFDGLLDAAAHPDADVFAAALAPRVVDSPALASLLLERLADAARTPSPEVVARTHTRVAEAVAEGRLDAADLAVPARVRTAAGSAADPDDVMVLDRACYAHVVPLERVAPGAPTTAPELAEVLDLPLASDVVTARVLGAGTATTLGSLPGAVAAFTAAALPIPPGRVDVHERLTVRLTGELSGDVDVPWWVDDDGLVHCTAHWPVPYVS